MKKNPGVPIRNKSSDVGESLRIDIPPAGLRIMAALKLLLQEKSFEAITTAEISRVAEANEALIYRYFKDKRGLLHQVLAEYTQDHLEQIQSAVDREQGALNKLRSLMKGTIAFHKNNRVFSQILLLEVRNYPGYFESEAYELVKRYARLIDEIIEEGIRRQEIRDNISLACVKDVIVGSIEHACLRSVVFSRDFDEDLLARNLTEAVINGLAQPGAVPPVLKDGPAGKSEMGKKNHKTRPGKQASELP